MYPKELIFASSDVEAEVVEHEEEKQEGNSACPVRHHEGRWNITGSRRSPHGKNRDSSPTMFASWAPLAGTEGDSELEGSNMSRRSRASGIVARRPAETTS